VARDSPSTFSEKGLSELSHATIPGNDGRRGYPAATKIVFTLRIICISDLTYMSVDYVNMSLSINDVILIEYAML